MATVPKTISITKKNEAWISARVDSGDYGNASENIRNLIRRDEQRETRINAIRAALIEREESGLSDMSTPQIMEAVEARLKADGRI